MNHSRVKSFTSRLSQMARGLLIPYFKPMGILVTVAIGIAVVVMAALILNAAQPDSDKWNLVLWVAMSTVVPFGASWFASHNTWQGFVQRMSGVAANHRSAAQDTTQPSNLNSSNTSDIDVDPNNYRGPVPTQEPTRRLNPSGVKHKSSGSSRRSSKTPTPQDTKNFPASASPSPVLAQISTDGTKAAAPTVAPQSTPDNILPFAGTAQACDTASLLPQSSAASGEGLQPGQLIHKVEPTYPPAALAQKVEGTVKIIATIGADGTVKTTQPLSGPRLLIHPSLDAVRQWQYSPTLLDGQPLESQRVITVAFQIAKIP